MAFNPVETVRANDSKIGLGLTIASEFCKDINYRYIFNQNMLTLKIQN